MTLQKRLTLGVIKHALIPVIGTRNDVSIKYTQVYTHHDLTLL